MSRFLKAARAAMDAAFHELFDLKDPVDSFRVDVKQTFADADPARVMEAFRRDIVNMNFGRYAKRHEGNGPVLERIDVMSAYPNEVTAEAVNDTMRRYAGIEAAAHALLNRVPASVRDPVKHIEQWKGLAQAVWGEGDGRALAIESLLRHLGDRMTVVRESENPHEFAALRKRDWEALAAAKALFDARIRVHTYEESRKLWADLGAALYGEDNEQVKELRSDPYADLQIDDPAKAYEGQKPQLLVAVSPHPPGVEGEQHRWSEDLIDTPYGAGMRARRRREQGEPPPSTARPKSARPQGMRPPFEYPASVPPDDQLMDKLEEAAKRERRRVEAPLLIANPGRWGSPKTSDPEERAADEAAETMAREAVVRARWWTVCKYNWSGKDAELALQLAEKYVSHVEATGRVPMPPDFTEQHRDVLIALIDWFVLRDHYLGDDGVECGEAEVWLAAGTAQAKLVHRCEKLSS